MKQIPFDINLRPEIESGRYKVEMICTSAGNAWPNAKVRIICWDMCSSERGVTGKIVGLVTYNGNVSEHVEVFYKDGVSSCNGANHLVLIDTQEPEVSEWEKAVRRAILGVNLFQKGENYEDCVDRYIKDKAKYLLELARKEILPQGYVTIKEKDYVKHLEPYIEKASKSWDGIDTDEFMKEVRGTGIDIEKVSATPDKPLTPREEGEAYLHICNKSYELGYKEGKTDTLNDLPRWKKVPEQELKKYASKLCSKPGIVTHRDIIIHELDSYSYYSIPWIDLLDKLPKE